MSDDAQPHHARTGDPRTIDQPPEFRQYRFRTPEGATDMLLIRHGESAPARFDSPAATVDGQADPNLDPRGRQEADLLAERFAHEAAIYITNLRRTAQTAAPLAARLD